MKGGSTRQAGKGLGNPPPPQCSPQQRGSPVVPRGGRAARHGAAPAGGAAPRPSAAPSLEGRGAAVGGCGMQSAPGPLCGVHKAPPPLCQGCLRASPLPAVRVLGPVKQQDGSRLGERGTGESLKEEFLIWNSLPLASPLGAVSTVPVLGTAAPKTRGFNPWTPYSGGPWQCPPPQPSPPGAPRGWGP